MNPDRSHYEVGKGKPPGAKFSSTNQPSNASKRAGRLKGLRGGELVRAILEKVAAGQECEVIRKEAAAYFKIKDRDVTVEILLIYQQAQRAILNKDTAAFTALMDRGFGKPQQKFNFDFTPPEPAEMKLSTGRVIHI